MAISTFEADEVVARANVNQRINQANAYFPVSVANGGTGRTSFTSGNILIGNGTSGINSTDKLSVSKGGTGQTSLSSGQILLGNGTSGITSTATLGVSKGGTGATTKKAARTNLDVFTVTPLYANDSGTTSTITLSSSIQNFNYIEIFTRNNDGRRMSVKFKVNATSPLISLMSSTVYDYAQYTPAIALKCSNIKISGTTITWQEQANSDLRASTVTTTATSDIKIYRVVGYSY